MSGLFAGDDSGIRLPARGRNSHGPTSVSAFVKLEARGADSVVCVVQAAPEGERVMGEMEPAEFLRQATAGRGLDFSSFEEEDWLRLPPTSCGKAAAWLRERGFAPRVLAGPRSRLSGFAERLGPRLA